MKATIKEVAREAGVSIATVSRVLNGKDRVKASTREKIEEAIKKLNFQVDQNARSMIKKETRTIGMIVPELSNEYWSHLFDALQDHFWGNGYTIIVGTTGRSLEKEAAILKSFLERRVDGIVFGTALPRPERDETMDWLSGYSIPAVSLDPKVKGMHCVVGDHLQGATDAVDHLLRLGRRDVAFIGGPTLPDNRELGYRNAHLRLGLQVNEALVRRTSSSATFQVGYKETKRLLEEKTPFTAVFGYNDAVAFGAVRALEEAGLRVPQDVAVVGYDDVQMAAMFKPPLTTVRQPVREIGEALAQLLLESLAMDPEARRTAPRKNVSFKTELIVRESCGAALMTPATWP
ncbi:LacI family DNA-binding transcriptional regulator [Paenibacillus sp.]|uniref:LacI family DNA-binding transcriptional regulator n=1 Tax=Paenibacillus sp. TaxID=58172 RepID=UPI002D395431|nr:LacI family DNA-binding transcriptional regulator [Paenibacillus sp.]HZG88143.1 LacI family DNA-binding transcriptional regulator [Paenibacillus sp.]